MPRTNNWLMLHYWMYNRNDEKHSSIPRQEWLHGLQTAGVAMTPTVHQGNLAEVCKSKWQHIFFIDLLSDLMQRVQKLVHSCYVIRCERQLVLYVSETAGSRHPAHQNTLLSVGLFSFSWTSLGCKLLVRLNKSTDGQHGYSHHGDGQILWASPTHTEGLIPGTHVIQGLLLYNTLKSSQDSTSPLFWWKTLSADRYCSGADLYAEGSAVWSIHSIITKELECMHFFYSHYLFVPLLLTFSLCQLIQPLDINALF